MLYADVRLETALILVRTKAEEGVHSVGLIQVDISAGIEYG